MHGLRCQHAQLVIKLWNHGEREVRDRGREEEKEEESLWYFQESVLCRAALQSTTVQKPTRYDSAAQSKLRYSQEELKKKSTERSRLAKSLLWFKQGTRPVVTSLVASEAGVGGAARTLPALGTVCVRGHGDKRLPPPARHPENYYSFVLKEHRDREKSTLGESYRSQHRLKAPKKHKRKGNTSLERRVCVELWVTSVNPRAQADSSGKERPGPRSSCPSLGWLGSSERCSSPSNSIRQAQNPSAKGHR